MKLGVVLLPVTKKLQCQKRKQYDVSLLLGCDPTLLPEMNIHHCEDLNFSQVCSASIEGEVFVANLETVSLSGNTLLRVITKNRRVL